MNIRIENLKKSYEGNIVLDIPLEKFEGTGIVGLVGNNGAGKTTLFRLMLDLLNADSGKIEINGINVCGSEEWKKQTGAYLDESFLIDYLTPEEFLHFIGRMSGLDTEETEKRIIAFGRFVSEEIWRGKKLIRDLSAGNRQKIGIIGALLNNPKMVILDEPFNFLDPSSQISLKRILKDYVASHQAIVFISSHNLEHTVDISSRILLLEKGVVQYDLSNLQREAGEILNSYFEGESAVSSSYVITT